MSSDKKQMPSKIRVSLGETLIFRGIETHKK